MQSARRHGILNIVYCKGGVGLEFAKKMLAFWLRLLLGLALLVTVCILAFSMASDYANIRIVVSDGLEARAGVILMQNEEDREELAKFFSPDFLAKDSAVAGESPYVQYLVRSFEHEVIVENCFAWPWDNKTVVKLIERVPKIEGEMLSEYKTEEQRKQTKKIPPVDWPYAGEYHVTLTRADGLWVIDDMTLLKTVPNAEPTPLAQPSISASPSASAAS